MAGILVVQRQNSLLIKSSNTTISNSLALVPACSTHLQCRSANITVGGSPMSFTPRRFPRFPMYCPVTYQTGLFEGHGTVWNLSLTGWRFSGNLPLRVGEVCSLTVNLSIDQRVYVAAGIVRWVRGEDFGVETLVIDDESQEDVEEYLNCC